MNTCGNCKLCCKLLGVKELDKPAGKWCDHCDKTGTLGCRVHATEQQPPSCKEFQCGYILGDLDESYRPDKSHVILTGQEDGLGCLIVHVDPLHPDAYKAPKIDKVLNALVDRGGLNGVTLIIGEKRRILARDMAVAQRIAEKME